MEKIFAPWLHSELPDLAHSNRRQPVELNDIRWKIPRGVSVGDDFPEDVAYDLSPNHPGVHLADSIPNVRNYYVVSEKLRRVLAQSTGHFGFHRIRIRNHRGRIEQAPYYIANLLDVVDCMDRKRSDYVVSALAPSECSTIRRLVLDHSKIPDDAQTFRLASEKRRFIVRNDLGLQMYNQAYEGVHLIKIEHYGEEFRPSDA